jgi:hypothetical protein
MSSRQALGIFSVLIVLGLGVWGLSEHSKSLWNEGKWQTLSPNQRVLVHTEKLGLDLTVEFKMQSEILSPNAPFTLEVLVSSQNVVEALDYQLVLPQGLAVVGGGSPTGQIQVSPEGPHKLEFTFSQSVEKNLVGQILFRSLAQGLSQAFAFPTLDFHEISKRQSELMERQSAYLSGSSGKKP